MFSDMGALMTDNGNWVSIFMLAYTRILKIQIEQGFQDMVGIDCLVFSKELGLKDLRFSLTNQRPNTHI